MTEINMKQSCIDWIGVIPNDWDIIRAKYAVLIMNGKEIENDEGEIPVYGTGGVFKFTNKWLYEGKSVLLGRKGTIDAPRYIDGKFWTVDTAFYSLMKKDILVKFFFYLACCFDYKKYQTGSTVPSMTQTAIGNIVIPKVSLIEQNQIVQYLDGKIVNIDGVIRDLENQIEIAEKYKKLVITESITKGLNSNAEIKESGVEWIGKISQNFTVTKMKFIVKVKDGTHDTPDYVEPSEETVPLITSKYLDFNNRTIMYDEANHITYQDYKVINRRSNVELYDIIMPMIGTIGNPVIVYETRPFSIKNVALFKTHNDLYFAKYLYYQFYSNIIDEQFSLLTTGGVQSFVSLNIIENLNIINVDSGLRNQIVDYLDEECSNIDSIIADKKSQLEKMKKYKNSLIYEYVTGKKRVKPGGENE